MAQARHRPRPSQDAGLSQRPKAVAPVALPGRARPSTDPSLAPGHYGAPLWHCKCAVQMESLSTFPLGLFPTEHSFLRIGFPGCCVRLPIFPACC